MSEVYDEKTGKPRPEVLKKHFVQEGLLEEEVAIRIISEGEMERKVRKGEKRVGDSERWRRRVREGDGGKSMRKTGREIWMEENREEMKVGVRDGW